MKILNIIDIPWNSGITNYAMELSKGLLQNGHKIFFAGVKNGLPLQIAKENGFETVEICTRKSPFILGSVLRLKKLIEKEGINIVNAHTGKSHFLTYLVSLLSKRKFVIIRTKSDTLYPKKNFLYRKTKNVIAASEFIRKRYLEIGLEPKKVVTIYQGIKLNNFRLPTSDFRLPIIGIIGRLDSVKGHKYLLESASIVLKKFPETKFLIAGKEENIKYEELKELAKKLGIEKSVEFLGFIENVHQFMSKCTLGVIASTGSEAVSRVLLEWMSSTKPVVATTIGCIPEILEKDFLVPPCNASAMARKIIELLQNPAIAKNAGETNRKKIEEKFNFEKFVTETEKIYESINM
ncbi:MAG: glycosyltransferase family 4 protein [Elusimicrobia bacterium]|nr:glycosyltransferase family 4 protein [Elusimicrobiota bacterium]